MIKHSQIILIVAAGIMLLVGCTKDPGLAEAGGITVHATIGQMTKVQYSTDGKGTDFTAGDKITVYGWTGGATAVPAERVVDGVVNTLGGDGKWTPEKQMRWKPGGEAHYFLGVSPARAITDFAADSFTLDPTKYAESDLLVATNVSGLKAQGNSVALSFEHALAKLNVNLKFRSQWETEPTVTSVTSMAKKTATVNYLAEAKLTATGTAEAVALTASSNAAWSGLQVPQTGVNTITVTIEGKDYMYTHTADIPLVSGSCTTVNLTVGRDRIELSNAITIADWTSQGAAMEGVAKKKELPKLNGHEFVDMGSGLLWATCNVGADNPWDYGDYFAWGETEPYYNSQEPLVWKSGKDDGYYWYSYFDTIDVGNTFTKYSSDKKTVLDAEDDAATANWGGPWRMPTDAEWTWLRDNCTWAWQDDYNGVTGMLVTSKVNGNQIFLPAAGTRDFANFLDAGSIGIYWSSCLYESISGLAKRIYFRQDVDKADRDRSFRYFGHSVRPVIGTPTPDPVLGDLYYSDGTYSSTLVEGKTPIGVIAYLGEDAFTETGTDVGGSMFTGRGLVLCLKNAASEVCWSTEMSAYEFGESARVNSLDALKRTSGVSGYGYTNWMVSMEGAETKYPAAYAARNYTELPAPAGTTGWFLPSAQQWVRMMTGLGGLTLNDIKWHGYFDVSHTAADKWETAMAKAGAKGTAYDSMTDGYLWYWSSSESTDSMAVNLHLDATGTGTYYGFIWYDLNKSSTNHFCRVRPVLAF